MNCVHCGVCSKPTSNTIWGLDATYQRTSPFITKMVDKLPFLETKAKSTLIATAEFAHLIPGHHKSLGNSGVSYIDDFEASKTGIDMKNMGAWFLSSIPQGQENIFPNAGENDDLISGFDRAKVVAQHKSLQFANNCGLHVDQVCVMR